MLYPAAILQSIHHRRGFAAKLIRFGLTILSLFYGLAIAIRNLAFAKKWLRVHRLPASVISVGNITTGGTGKTPVVAWLAQHLLQITNRKPVILSRGYGSDELQLLRQILPHTPHFVDKRRFKAGEKALATMGEDLVFLLDDGFQHRHLHRDVDIVLIDTTAPFGLGYLLPRGFLREPVSHLQRANVIILTKCDLIPEEKVAALSLQLTQIAPNALQVISVHHPKALRRVGSDALYSPDILKGHSVFLFAAIGNPDSFYHLVCRLGAQVVARQYFPDHYHYRPWDIQELHRKAKLEKADALITTAKDAVKIGFSTDQTEEPREFQSQIGADIPIWILDIEAEIYEGADSLLALLQKMTTN